MAKAKEFDLGSLSPAIEDEDNNPLTAIDDGIRDTGAGRTTPIEEIRKRLHNWITLRLQANGANGYRRNSDI